MSGRSGQVQPATQTESVQLGFDTGGSEWSDGFDPSSEFVSFNYESDQPIFSPATVADIEQAIAEYNQIAMNGGWARVQAEQPLSVGMSNPNVRALRERLMATGDLSVNAGVSSAFDTYVEAAVRRFQSRHGLHADGVVGGETLRALNVPVWERIDQLEINLERVRSMVDDMSDRFVMVNVPGAEIQAVEGNRVVSHHNAVVGLVERQTPLLTSRIIEVNFNPYWHVPRSIVRRDIIPKMREEPDYLANYNIRIYDQNGDEIDPQAVDWETDEAVNYLLRQDPGEQNSLGSVRINFPNEHSVFLHDTPLQNLFGINDRLDSSGCVRIQNVRQLVTWLLSPNGDWSRSKVDEVIRSGERIDAQLDAPVTLHMAYITAWAVEGGVVHFRNDIYDRDRDGIADAVASGA